MTEITANHAAAEMLAPAFADHLIGSEFLNRAAKHLSPSDLLDYIRVCLPQDLNLKRGFFGEVLAAKLLEDFYGHLVPVKKLRYRLGGADSPKGTDILALKIDARNQLSQMAYVEAKLRTTRSDITRVAADAHDQLRDDCGPNFPSVLRFVDQILQERNDAHFDIVMDYLRDRANLKLDSHHIFLVVDGGCWRESDLEPLSSHPDLLEPLAVHIVKLANLPQKVEGVYGLVGVKVIADDD